MPGTFPIEPEGSPGALEALTGVGEHTPAVPRLADADVIADVIATDYQPYFSSGSSGIYTEFRLCVADVLWNARAGVDLGPGARIEVFRLGGAIRDAEGKTYRVKYVGSLRPLLPGRRFLVYLRWDADSQAYVLVGGYELARTGTAANLNSRNTTPSKTVSEVLREARNEAAGQKR